MCAIGKICRYMGLTKFCTLDSFHRPSDHFFAGEKPRVKGVVGVESFRDAQSVVEALECELCDAFGHVLRTLYRLRVLLRFARLKNGPRAAAYDPTRAAIFAFRSKTRQLGLSFQSNLDDPCFNNDGALVSCGFPGHYRSSKGQHHLNHSQNPTES